MLEERIRMPARDLVHFSVRMSGAQSASSLFGIVFGDYR